MPRPVTIQKKISNTGSCQTTPLLTAYHKVPNIPIIGMIVNAIIIVRNSPF